MRAVTQNIPYSIIKITMHKASVSTKERRPPSTEELPAKDAASCSDEEFIVTEKGITLSNVSIIVNKNTVNRAFEKLSLMHWLKITCMILYCGFFIIPSNYLLPSKSAIWASALWTEMLSVSWSLSLTPCALWPFSSKSAELNSSSRIFTRGFFL